MSTQGVRRADGPPIFILGNPRSGTTLLRRMLNAHPHLVVAPECGFLQWLEARWGSWSIEDMPSLPEYVADVLTAKKFETWGLSEDELLAGIRARAPRTYAELGGAVVETYAQRENPSFRRWGDKNNYYVQHVAQLHRLFPYASFVLITRDPRDVACSYRDIASRSLTSRYRPRLPTGAREIALEWVENHRVPLSVIEPVEVRYEHLVAEPEAVLTRLCKALELPYDQAMLTYHAVSSAREPEDFLGWKERVTQPPTAGRVARYQTELPEEDRETIEDLAGPWMERFGYL